MTLADRIKALPSIKDANGAECVSREVVLAMLKEQANYWKSQKWCLDTLDDERPAEYTCADELAAGAAEPGGVV